MAGIGSIGRACRRCGANEWYLRANGNHQCAPCCRAGSIVRQRKDDYAKLYMRKKRLDPEFKSKMADWRKEYEQRPEQIAVRRERDRHRYRHNPIRRAYAMKTSNERKPIDRITKYGLTIDQYHAMFEAQGERCNICRRVIGSGNAHANIDHDHRTGAVRGLLCGNCNTGIGLLQDSPDTVRAASDYLERSRARQMKVVKASA